jgi:plasmid stabilization system protein ParE
MARKIIWEDHAIELFIKAIEWISKDSVFQAEKVEKAILEKIEELPNYPENTPQINLNYKIQVYSGLLKHIVTEYLISLMIKKSEF